MKVYSLVCAVFVLTFTACTQQVKTTPPPEEKMAANPFFEEYATPFDAPPFDRIKNEHYLPAFEKAMELHSRQVAEIVGRSEAPTFENTVEALDRAGEPLTRVARTFFGLMSADTNDEMQKIAQKLVPRLSKHKDDILLNQDLFKRVKVIYEKKDELKLNVEQSTLLQELYLDFVRGGADLDDQSKVRLREINKQLSLLNLKFRENILKENNKFEIVLEKKEDLAGLPERVVAAATKAAKERGHEGKWVFTLHKPSLIPFLQFSSRRELREKMFSGYISRGNNGDELDNKENLKKIIALRVEKAKLLGYKTYADFQLVRRMAKNPKNVYKLLDQVWKAALPVAKREAEELQALIKKEGQDFKLQPWDWWYYAEKLRKAKYDLDENELRPYFKLENVLNGAFEVATKLYGIQFKERDDIPKYHKDVRTFEVQEKDGSHIGIFYVDYFPRASKRGGAWCGGYREQSRREGKKITPLIVNVGNFSMPTGDKPALLSFEEVETLFHEFGHALHALLADTTYAGSSDNIKVDFVELPSQIMENWASEPEVLKMYAKHYQTNEPIPDQLIEKLEKSRYFNQGFVTVEYLAACFLDMDWHMLDQAEKLDVVGFETKSLDKIGLIPEIVVRYKSHYFAHIFSGDYYSAGYYSYVWAQVLDADAFEAFKETGLFDQKTAESFRKNILSRGGAEDPMTLYKRFRGAEPEIEPLLKRKGMNGGKK
ncbi:MAG: M3 family metallopeptidase [Deltaproteobacteria bacterium]|nr:M3 family metallopeptidase [Deltaproteobacteria bacterium]